MPYIQFQFRRGLATDWTNANTLLASGELGLETDTKRVKIGDGILHWNDLPYGLGLLDLQTVTEYGNITNVAVNISNTDISSNTASGALTVAGGAGIGGNLFVGANLNVVGNSIVSNNVLPSSNNVIDLGAVDLAFNKLYVGGNGISVNGVNVTSNGSAIAIGNITLPVAGDLVANSVTSNSYVSTHAVIGNATSYVVGTGNTVIDYFGISSHTTAKYIVQAEKDPNYHSMEAFLVNDGTNVYLTSYAGVKNNVDLISLNAEIFAGNVQLNALGTTTGINVKVFSTKI